MAEILHGMLLRRRLADPFHYLRRLVGWFFWSLHCLCRGDSPKGFVTPRRNHGVTATRACLAWCSLSRPLGPRSQFEMPRSGHLSCRLEGALRSRFACVWQGTMRSSFEMSAAISRFSSSFLFVSIFCVIFHPVSVSFAVFVTVFHQVSVHVASDASRLNQATDGSCSLNSSSGFSHCCRVASSRRVFANTSEFLSNP